MSSASIFLGDELSAAGYRLAGVDARVPSPGDEAACFERALKEARIVLVGSRCAKASIGTRNVNPGQQTLELLRIAEDYRADHCQALLAKASQDSRAILEAAHVAARRDLRSTLSPERERLAAEIAAAEAKEKAVIKQP